jgi:hypothetical protein
MMFGARPLYYEYILCVYDKKLFYKQYLKYSSVRDLIVLFIWPEQFRLGLPLFLQIFQLDFVESRPCHLMKCSFQNLPKCIFLVDQK